MQHESTSVRRAVIDHAVEVLRRNRRLFACLIESEEAAGMTFLTVLKEDGNEDNCSNELRQDMRQNGGGVVSALMQTLLNRFILEQDAECRISLATLAGEIGAIDPNRLQLSDSPDESDASAGETQMISWRLSQPPWKTEMHQYGLQLVTTHLVRALKSSPTTQDQHKIAFAIQECLSLLDSSALVVGQTDADFDRVATTTEDNKASNNRDNMSLWLHDALEKAGVLEIVEPFWKTSYKQVSIAGIMNVLCNCRHFD